MFENNFKDELMAFLPKEEVELLEADVTSVINKFPLDIPKKKNYLNILINIFLRYRTQNLNIQEITKLPLLEIGSNPKEVTLKQNRIKINFLEFKNIDNFFSQLDITNLDKYFTAISQSVVDTLDVIDFSKNSLEHRVSIAINEQQSKIFDLEGIFYTYINTSLVLDKNDMFFPEKKENDEVLEKIYSIVRYYAWTRSSLAWNEFVSSEREITSLSDHYQALQWFLDGYLKRSTPFNVHSPNRYDQYMESLKNGEYKQKKRVTEVFNFTSLLVDHIKDIYTLLNNSPFAVQKENKSNLFDIFKRVIGLQFTQSDDTNLSLEDITNLFKSLKIIFSELDLSLEEFYELNSSNIIDSLLVLIVKQIDSKVLPVEFPFTLIWESKNKSLVDEFINKYSLSLVETNVQMLEFLIEYTHSGVTKENFASYFNKLFTIETVQKKLLEIGDIADYDVVKFDDAEYLSKKNSSYDFMDLKKLNEIENNIRQALNNLKKIWIHDISGDPIFINDPSFKKYFPLHLGQEKIEYVSEIEIYLEKWEEYKQNSEIIKDLQETIKTVSTVKEKLEGEQLVSGEYPGALSLIRAQKLIVRENNRLLLKLKDLITSVSKFKFNEGFSEKLDPKILNQSDSKLIDQSLMIIEQIHTLEEELSSVDFEAYTFELKVFSSFIKELLGSETRILQLKKYSDTLLARYKKMKADPVVINIGLHFVNMNDSIMNIASILKETNESLQKFYSNSLNKEIFDEMNTISTSHNLSNIIESIKKVNSGLSTVVSNLASTFSQVSTYFDVFADIVFQMMQKYGRLVSRNDFYSRMEKSRINFYEEEGSIILTDKISETASILEKQLFMEKTFSLYVNVSRACEQINFAIEKSFNNLFTSDRLSIDKIERNLDVTSKVNIMTKNVDNFYKFLDSIHLPSKKYIQSIKTSLKNVAEVISPIKGSNKLVAELSNANKLINATNKRKGGVNYGLLRKLNDSLNKILRFLDASVLDFFNESDEAKKKEILDFIRIDNNKETYPKKLTNKINKIREVSLINKSNLKTSSLSDLMSKTEQIVQEETMESQEIKSVVAEDTQEITEEVVAEVVTQESAVEDVTEEIVEEVNEDIVEAVAEEEAEEVVEAVVEEITEELVDEGVTEEVAEEVAEEVVVEAIVEETTEEITEELVDEGVAEEVVAEAVVEEPEPDQLGEDEEEAEMDLEDNYEPDIDETAGEEDDSDDLISEMEKLLNVGGNKREK